MKLIDESKLNPNNNKPKNQRELSQLYNFSIGCVNNILKRHKEIKEAYEKNVNCDRIYTQIRKSPNKELNKMMLDIFQLFLSRQIPITGPMIQQQALDFAQQLKIASFNASDGWLSK
jgi:hypothetical protein